MEPAARQEIEAALEDKSDETKTYVRTVLDLMERHVALANANPYDIELCQKLLKQMAEEAEALKAAYLESREKQGLPQEVGFPV